MSKAAPKAKQKSATQLSESDIRHKAEMWARYQRQIAAVEKEREQDPALIAAQQKVDAITEAYDAQVESLAAKADRLHAEVTGWLISRQPKKTILEKIIEAKTWIASLARGKKKGSRQADPQKFIARCKQLKKDPWKAVVVVIKDGEPILGKDDFDKICTKPDAAFNEATLELK